MNKDSQTSFNFIRLNLPQAQLNLRHGPSNRPEVYDRWRRRWVALTPEEWVRQHFTSMLVQDLGYPEGRIANEITVDLNGSKRRCDTVVYDDAARPFMLVEYKAAQVAITQHTFDQIVRYCMILKARLLVVSNGLTHYCCEIDYESHSYKFLKEIPPYSGTV